MICTCMLCSDCLVYLLGCINGLCDGDDNVFSQDIRVGCCHCNLSWICCSNAMPMGKGCYVQVDVDYVQGIVYSL